MSLQCCWNLVIQIFFLPIVYPMHVTLVLSIAESSKIVNLKHAAKPQEWANWDAIAIAQSLAKQKHTASIILFSGSSWKAQHSMNITCILSHFSIFFWHPQIVWYFFHCKWHCIFIANIVPKMGWNLVCNFCYAHIEIVSVLFWEMGKFIKTALKNNGKVKWGVWKCFFGLMLNVNRPLEKCWTNDRLVFCWFSWALKKHPKSATINGNMLPLLLAFRMYWFYLEGMRCLSRTSRISWQMSLSSFSTWTESLEISTNIILTLDINPISLFTTCQFK